jgi:phosphotriesterase-related protein
MTSAKPFVRTVGGDIPTESLGLILPHEHLFVDLRGPLTPGYGQGDPQEVAALVKPHLEAAQASGVTALVECSTLGVWRNVQVLAHLAALTPIHIIAPTGVYREAFVPPHMRDLSAEQFAANWITDLTRGMDGTDIRAGWIKIAMSDDGPTPLEARILQAAAQASSHTGAVVGSHTIGGRAAREALDILESNSMDMNRFIWIHTQSEPDISIHLEAAKRGVYVEYDAIGAPYQSQEAMVDAVIAVLEAGYGDQILLSHDAGWYEPGQPGGIPKDGYRGYTALIESFLPALRARGVSEADITRLTVTNPARAFTMRR